LIRLIILCFTIIVGISGEAYLFKLSFLTENIPAKIVLSFLLCLIPIIIAFTLYQNFKGFRFNRRVYIKRGYESNFFFKLIGVPLYQYILVNSFLKHANPRVYLNGRKREYIKIYHEETKQSETSHLLSLFGTWPIQIIYITEGQYLMFFTLTLFTVLFNFYPIQLQRMNRFVLEERFNNLIK